MFKASVAIKEYELLGQEKKNLEDRIRKLEFQISCKDREKQLAIEESKNQIRKDMQKDLVESDLRRVRAEAKLETYEKIDTKEQVGEITKMLDKAIAGLSAQKVQIVK